MSYRDPYSEQQAAGSHGRYPNKNNQLPQSVQPSEDHPGSYPSQQTYGDMGGEGFNPYESKTQYKDDQQDAEDSYSRGGYTYGAYEGGYNYPPVQRRPTQMTTSSKKSKPSIVVPVRRSGFEQGEFTPSGPHARKNRTPKSLREYRYDHQGNLWTKGGKGRCAGRVCCCTLMTTVFLVVSIVLALALWVRPPSIQIGSVQTVIGENGTTIQQQADGISIDLGVNISVQNPNYFSVDFKKIQAQIFYPIDNTPVGGGTANNIEFKSRSKTDFTFPFSLAYNTTNDPQSKIILDLANKCGVVGDTKSNINVNYKITLGIRILLITISPVISNQFNFPCPLKASDISKFMGGSST